METLKMRIGLAAAILGITLGVTAARASIFNFDDVYIVTSSGGFSTAFPGNTGPGYSSAGYYQRTQDASGGGVLARRLGNTSAVPGEYLENTTPNATAYLQLNGWYGPGTAINGQAIGSVYNTVDTGNGGSLYFQYRVGTTSGSDGSGTLTPFTFNSFQLRGNSSIADFTFVLDGQDGSGNTIFTDTLHVTGNTLTTFTENWAGVSTVIIPSVGTSGGGIGIGGLYMDNVKINETVIPEPATIAIWSLLAGLGISIGWWQRRKQAVRQS